MHAKANSLTLPFHFAFAYYRGVLFFSVPFHSTYLNGEGVLTADHHIVLHTQEAKLSKSFLVLNIAFFPGVQIYA